MGICMKLWYASFSKVFRRWQVLTIFLHRYASLDTKVRPRFDGDRVYVHDSIVLTVIGGSTHVTHSMFVTFWRDKRGFMYLHVMSSWWDFGLKTMQHTHDLWILVIHPDSWYLYRTTLNLQQCCSAWQDRSQEFAWRLYQHDIKGFQADCIETQWIQQRRCPVAGPCGCCLLQLSGMGRPYSLPCLPCFSYYRGPNMPWRMRCEFHEVFVVFLISSYVLVLEDVGCGVRPRL